MKTIENLVWFIAFILWMIRIIYSTNYNSIIVVIAIILSIIGLGLNAFNHCYARKEKD